MEIDVKEVHELQQSSESCLLLDCREPMEVQLVNINGAMHIPMQETPNRLEELEPHRNERIVVFCHHGMRSLQVAQWLRSQGYDKVQTMAGGIDQWAAEIDPEMIRY